MDMETNPQDHGLVSRIGPVEVDWPRSIGYFGGVTLATALGIIEPPIAIFIAAVPFFRAFIRPSAPRPVRFTGQVLAGAAIPVGGGGRAAIEPVPQQAMPAIPAPASRWSSILIEARQLANQAGGQESLNCAINCASAGISGYAASPASHSTDDRAFPELHILLDKRMGWSNQKGPA